MSRLGSILAAVVAAIRASWRPPAQMRKSKTLSLSPTTAEDHGYANPRRYLRRQAQALSKGTMLIDQYPGAQLGQEPQVLQLVNRATSSSAFLVAKCRDAVAAGRRDVDLHFLSALRRTWSRPIADRSSGRQGA